MFWNGASSKGVVFFLFIETSTLHSLTIRSDENYEKKTTRFVGFDF